MNETMEEAWERLSPLLKEALDRGGSLFSLEDVWKTVQNGQSQFWPGQHSAVVTEIREYPRAKIFHVWLGGGDLDEILRMVPALKKFGKAWGCSRITMSGRPGWAKVLKLKSHGVMLYENL